MELNKFKNLTLLARINYGIMCAENYVLALYPNRNWEPFFNRMWMINKEGIYWDEWSYEIMEIIPEYLFEFDNYEAAQFEYISKEEYSFFTNLLKDTSENFNTLLLCINNILVPYLYTSISDNYLSTIPELTKIDEILVSEKIALPEISKLYYIPCKEVDLWGKGIDPKKLSKII